MTQHDAKTAVRRLQRKIIALTDLMLQHLRPQLPDEIYEQLNRITDDLNDLECQLSIRKQAVPNCRPATQAELDALCQGGNAVMFPAVA